MGKTAIIVYLNSLPLPSPLTRVFSPKRLIGLLVWAAIVLLLASSFSLALASESSEDALVSEAGGGTSLGKAFKAVREGTGPASNGDGDIVAAGIQSLFSEVMDSQSPVVLVNDATPGYYNAATGTVLE